MSRFYDVSAVREALRGPVPSITPQFHSNGEIDWKSLENILENCIGGGAKALMVTNGDSLLTILTDRETVELNRFVTKVSDGRAMVITCSKAWCHHQMVEFAQTCKDMGSDLVIPFYPDWAQSLDTEALTQCYREIGDIMPVMLLTNLCNGRGIPMNILKELTPEDGIVALKDDMPPPYGKKALAITREKFAFLHGGRAFNYMDVAPFGADGYLSVFGRVYPALAARWWKIFRSGDMKTAVEMVEHYDGALFAMIADNGLSHSAVMQGMYEAAGLGQRWRRSPYSSLTDGQLEMLRQFLADRGLV